MSKPLWSGNRPENNLDAIACISQAALSCLKRLGFEKTTMSDIAKEAGISRPTLYKYFKNKPEVLFAAIDGEAYRFAESVVAHARKFNSLEQRIVETIIYVVQEFPKNTHLSIVLDDDKSGPLRQRAFSDDATKVFSQMTAEPLLELSPELDGEGEEISEIMSRFAMSMILFPGSSTDDYQGLRRLISKRVLPGLLPSA